MQFQQQLALQQQELIQQLQMIQRQYLMHQGMNLQPLLLAQQQQGIFTFLFCAQCICGPEEENILNSVKSFSLKSKTIFDMSSYFTD